MKNCTCSTTGWPPLDSERAVPWCMQHVRIIKSSFMYEHSPDQLTDLVAATVAIGWQWLAQLDRFGEIPPIKVAATASAAVGAALA